MFSSPLSPSLATMMSVLLLLIILLLVSSVQADFNGFVDCKQQLLQCGDHSFKVDYPFRLPQSQNQCGYPGFELYCTDNTPLIQIGSTYYKVNDIDYIAQEIYITDSNFANGTSCPQNPFTNFSFDPLLFEYGYGDLNLTLYLNCPPNLSVPKSYLYNLSCGKTDPMYQSFYTVQNDLLLTATIEALSRCESVVYVPVNETEEAELTTDGMSGLLGALKEGFGLIWKVGEGWCGECVKSLGICGYNPSSPKERVCYCSDSTSQDGECVPNAVPATKQNTRNKHSAKKIPIVIGFAGFLLVSLSLVLCLYKHRKVCNSIIFCEKNLDDNQNIEDFLEEYGSVAPKRYTYSQVKRITKAFKEKLGQGGFGTVFKGTLSDGHMVAVKMLNDSKGNGDEFLNEVASIGRTSHVNIVSLRGFCSEGHKRALIYDLMCNGSLEKLLYTDKPKTILDWEKLYQIAIGIARGLEYLHRGCNTRIVHFDIKPHNILLDQEFCPKISDFGLAKLCLVKDSIISIAGARGTIGYIAPEVFSRNFGVVSSKSDVYSYGMMVLEMAEGKKNPNHGVENSSEMYFPHWIYEHLNQNRDLVACGVNAESEETIRKMILVGLWCIQTLPQNRPSMSRVIEMLEGSVDDLKVPPKPYLSSSPLGSLLGSSSIQDICWIDDSSSVHS